MSALPDTQSDFSHEIIGAAVEVQISTVDSIPAEKSGKYRYIVSHAIAAQGARVDA